MDYKNFQAHIDAEKAERDAKPFIIRMFLNLGDFLRYRVWGWIKDLPTDIRHAYQYVTKGYTDRAIWDLDNFIINTVHGPLMEFVTHHEEQGKKLPVEFSTDPAAWLEILKKIQFSFDHAYREMNEMDYDPYTPLNEEQRVDFDKRVQEGFELFGKHLRGLWN